MNWSVAFQPLVSLPLLVAAIALLLALAAAGVAYGVRGAWVRAAAAAALLLALANPTLLREEREPLKSVVAVVVDRSQSQTVGDRAAQIDAALAALKDRLGRFPQFELRVVEATSGASGSAGAATNLFEALSAALRDVPPSRVGGAVMITDGQVHDIPENLSASGFSGPLQALITGSEDERDRKIEFVRAPRFALANQPLQMTYRVTQDGAEGQGPVTVQVFVDGDLVATESATPGVETPLDLTLPHAGANIVEIAVDRLEDEITTMNNRAIASVEGIRENLRVLLVSGEPHAGERAWRNLLKSDASVDLVHFTILRPPEKQDGTPINELSLIAFPTRELFVEKIEDFDLIVLDRYQHRDVLPVLYYDYIAQYVQNGGALLVAAGPEYAGADSIARTPLIAALPAMPTGEVTQAGYHPRLSDDGRKHPVTRDLEGADAEPPQWGRWFRTVGISDPQGEVVMRGASDEPLLVLNRFGEGRVGLLLSDQGWLWARGFEGGGPHVNLYRRIAHWLMQEPELEEEALTAKAAEGALVIRRQTMGDDPGPARIILPSGETSDVTLAQEKPGLWTATLETGEIGLYQIANGDLKTLAHVGPVDAPEFRDMISTTAPLGPVAEATGGSVRRIDRDGTLALPGIAPVRGQANASGRDWIGLRTTSETVLKGVDRLPLFAGLLGLSLLLAAFAATWYREGR